MKKPQYGLSDAPRRTKFAVSGGSGPRRRNACSFDEPFSPKVLLPKSFLSEVLSLGCAILSCVMNAAEVSMATPAKLSWALPERGPTNVRPVAIGLGNQFAQTMQEHTQCEKPWHNNRCPQNHWLPQHTYPQIPAPGITVQLETNLRLYSQMQSAATSGREPGNHTASRAALQCGYPAISFLDPKP